MKKGRDDFICKWGAIYIYIVVNDEYNEIGFHYGDDLQIYFRIFLSQMGSYNYAIVYLKLNGIPRQSVSRDLSNISKAYPKIEADPELLTTRYCTIWERYPPWSSIIYSRVQECFVDHEHPWFTGHVTSKHWPRNQSMPWKSHVLTS